MKSLSEEVGISERMLAFMVSKSDHFYKEYWKKNLKKARLIRSPNKELKGLQRWILFNILDVQMPEAAHGFVSGRSTVTNAMMHLGNRFVLVIDIDSFFSSIGAEQVYEVFRNLGYSEESSQILTKLTTFEGFLPQGAPSSPAISNLYFSSYDKEILAECSKLGITYTRYADDLTFSSNNLDDLKKLKKIAQQIIESRGVLKLKETKTRFLTGKGPISITGININSGKLKVPAREHKKFRAILYNKIVKKEKIPWRKINGYYSYILSVEPNFRYECSEYIRKLKKIADENAKNNIYI